jgi:lipoprotein NlpI
MNRGTQIPGPRFPTLQQAAKDQATRLFRLAVADCPRDFIELHAANIELKTLGAAP